MIVVGISLVVDELRKGQRLVFRYRIAPILVASLVHSKRQRDAQLSFISTTLFPISFYLYRYEDIPRLYHLSVSTHLQGAQPSSITESIFRSHPVNLQSYFDLSTLYVIKLQSLILVKSIFNVHNLASLSSDFLTSIFIIMCNSRRPQVHILSANM